MSNGDAADLDLHLLPQPRRVTEWPSSAGHWNIHRPVAPIQDQEWVRWLPALLFGLTGLLVVLGGAGIARYLFPALALVISAVLYRRTPVTYVSFVWWLWFLTPLIRRLVDFRGGWVDPSPVLLAPALATLACLPSLFSNGHLWRRRSARPFILVFAAVIYGFLVGLLSLPLKTTCVAALNWVAPLVFGFHLFAVHSERNAGAAYAKATQRTFLWGLLIMGTYGVVQLLVAPPWDQFWMLESHMDSIGSPEPLGIRVFSTMNSPGPLGTIIAAGLLLLFGQRGVMAKLATVGGALSLILSLARAAWLSWLAGALLMAVKQKKYRFSLLAGLVLVVLALGGLATYPGTSEIVGARLDSFTNLKDDASYQDRQNGSRQLFAIVASEPLGRGLGATETVLNTDLGSHDNGPLEMALSLGWVGAACYLGALLMIGYFFVTKRGGAAPFYIAAGSISLGIMAQLVLGSAMLGVEGVALWGFAGTYLASEASSA